MHLRGCLASDVQKLCHANAIESPNSPLIPGSWHERLKTVTAIARRPLWQRRRCNQGLIDMIQSWTPMRTPQMTRMAMRCLGSHSRALYFHNLGKASGQCAFHKATIKTSFCFSRTLKRDVCQIVQRWLTSYRHKMGRPALVQFKIWPQSNRN